MDGIGKGIAIAGIWIGAGITSIWTGEAIVFVALFAMIAMTNPIIERKVARNANSFDARRLG